MGDGSLTCHVRCLPYAPLSLPFFCRTSIKRQNDIRQVYLSLMYNVSSSRHYNILIPPPTCISAPVPAAVPNQDIAALPPSPQSGYNRTGVIVGSLLCGFTVLAALVVILYVVRRNRKRARKRSASPIYTGK